MGVTPNSDGPDTSHYQTIVDPASVPRFGLWSTKVSEGQNGVDYSASNFIKLARSKGTEIVGVYHWIRPDSPIDAQVANLKRQIDALGLAPADGELVPGVLIQLDWEVTAGLRPMTVAEVELWCKLVKAHWGDRVIVYGAEWVPGFPEWRQRNPDFPVWYANYNLTDPLKSGWAKSAQYKAAVWQWTSQAKVPGILTGGVPRCDMNHVFDWATLRRLAHLPLGDDMADPIVTNKEQFYNDAPGVVKFIIMPDGTLRHLNEIEWTTRGALPGVPWTSVQIGAAGMYTPAATTIITPPAVYHGTLGSVPGEITLTPV